MSDYIKRSDAYTAIHAQYPQLLDAGVHLVINAIPAADVVDVVRCRDCKWYEINELKQDGTEDRRFKPSVCMLAGQRRKPMYYCADGERRSEWTTIPMGTGSAVTEKNGTSHAVSAGRRK